MSACLLTTLVLAACGPGSLTSVCELENNSAPEQPTIIVPLEHSLEATSDSLKLSASEFQDADPDDGLATTEFELWLLAGSEPIVRVWSAEILPSEAPTPIGIEDGIFDAGFDELSPWQRYGARVRHVDTRCAASEWTPLAEFRIDDGSTYFFGTDQVRDFHLTIPPDSWDAIDAEATPPGCVPYQRNYYTGTLATDDETFEGVGLRVKGGCGSARHLDGKAGFKVHLAWDDPDIPGCPDKRRHHGLQRFTFNNQVQDRSFLHERLGYHLYKLLGVPTPRVAPMRLFVNDELWGLYLNVETIDRRFLDRWFRSNDGMLYEGTYHCDLIPANIPADETGSSCVSRKFEDDLCSTPDPGADPTTYGPARTLVTQLEALEDQAFYPEIEQIFDFDTFLSLWAVDTIIGHWDGYTFRIVNNYRFYHDPATDRWTIIPTGIDQTFVDDEDGWAPTGLLATRCLSETDCEAAFAARLSEALEIFEQADLKTLAEQTAAEIRPLVEQDPRKGFGIETFDSAASNTATFIEERGDEIRQQLADHGY